MQLLEDILNIFNVTAEKQKCLHLAAESGHTNISGIAKGSMLGQVSPNS